MNNNKQTRIKSSYYISLVYKNQSWYYFDKNLVIGLINKLLFFFSLVFDLHNAFKDQVNYNKNYHNEKL